MAISGHSAAAAKVAAVPRRFRGGGRRSIYYALFAILGVAIVAGVVELRRAADNHLRAMSILVRLTDTKAHGWITRFSNHPFREETGSAQTPQGELKYRLYIPTGVSQPPGIVLVQGIHREGIEERRLVHFGQVLAGSGVEVMTPELPDLANYRVTAATIDTIGEAAVVLGEKMFRAKVGILGLSFSGGLALLAAARPEFRDRIGLVLAVGGHDDMARVARFFAANMIEKPDGSSVALKAHEYGPLILAYSHPEDFFHRKDVPVATVALRQWLWEEPADSTKTADSLTAAGKRQLDRLLYHRGALQQTFLRVVERHQEEMDAVSPHGRLSELRVPVFLLHGATDTIIPPSETLWLAKDVPPQALKRVLVSRAMNMIHVDGEHPVTLGEKWDLVNFFAAVLRSVGKLAQQTSSH